MVNVCFLTPEYLPLIGGTGSYVYYLARNLARLENLVYVITKNSQENVKGEQPSGKVKVLRIKTIKIPLLESALFYVHSSKKLMEVSGKFPIEVVHVNLPLVPSFAVPKNLGEALVTTVHTTWKSEGDALKHEPFLGLNGNEKIVRSFNSLLRFFEHKLLERSDKIIAVSTHTKMELLEHYDVSANKVHVIYNGVDINKFKPTDEKDKVKREMGFVDDKVVLYVGRLYRRKGLRTLLKAVPFILRKIKDVKFVISGKGFRNEEKELRVLASKLKVEKNVFFLGYTPDDKLPKLYQAAEVFVLPSVYEGMPFTLLEALASGLPVVATNVGGIPEVVNHGENGLLVKSQDLQGLVEGILYLLENPDFAHEMGLSGRKTVEKNFSWQKVARQVLEVYNEVLAK
ncbi:MAG: glycosyltransferase family 4 protein [Candidatus Bathyarchaeota archaeon]|nr:glycosyltransferase family 4 protein [Candidatus Bathyarchaeota archaeon]MDW8040604.1 glycosyltransferase family 4 protein [Nitrososphaerota archaeon]